MLKNHVKKYKVEKDALLKNVYGTTQALYTLDNHYKLFNLYLCFIFVQVSVPIVHCTSKIIRFMDFAIVIS